MLRIKPSLRHSFLEGAFASYMLGLVETYVTPFALALGATIPQIGLLASFPNLVAALAQSQSQPFSKYLGGSKKTVLFLTLLQAFALCMLPLLLVLPVDFRVQSLIVLAILFTTSGNLLLSIWGGIIAKFLPVRRRSGYFGWRSRLMGLIYISGTLVSGLILSKFSRPWNIGFVVIFLMAALVRFLSYIQAKKVYEPKFRHRRSDIEDEAHPHRAHRRSFYRFLAFSGFMGFSANLVGPLFAVHMLKSLQFSYFTYMMLMIAAQFTTFFMMAPWGAHADLFGNLKMIRVCSYILPILPIAWIVNSNPFYLFVCQIFGGSIWAGYNLCTTNYVFDAMPASERIQSAATFNMVNGFAIFLGATIGSQLVGVLPSLCGFRFFSLLIVSSVGRIIAGHVLLPRVQEVRAVQPVKTWDLLVSVSGLKSLPGLLPGLRRVMIRPTSGV